MSYTPRELRAMDDEEARQTLTVEQYERREKLLDLDAQVEETEERFAEEAREVEDIVVHADAEQLGTRVDVFGNDLLVHIDPDNRQFRAAAQRLDDAYGDADTSETDDLGDDAKETIADELQTMLDEVLLRWNGEQWSRLSEDKRETILAEARAAWGVNGLVLAWVDIAEAVAERRDDRMDVIDSFRGT